MLDETSVIFSGCAGLDPNWEHVKLFYDVEFPVAEGTVVNIQCEKGFLLRGSYELTCVEGTLTYSEEPRCGQ